jgi:hypothetical protein
MQTCARNCSLVTVAACVFGHCREYSSEDLAWTSSVVSWSVFLAANPEVPGSIPRATRFFE